MNKAINIPKLRFPEFSEVWDSTKLGKFLVYTPRVVPKPSEPYLALGIRSHFNGTFQKHGSDPSKIAMEELYVVHEGDFLVNITFAWEGALAIANGHDEGGLVSHRFPTYIFNNQVSQADFFIYVFPTRRMKYKLGIASPGGAGRNRVLNKRDFLDIEVFLPTITEQGKIAAFISTVDAKTTLLQKKVTAMKKYKRGVMQAIFSGKLRFRDESGNTYPDWQGKSLGDIAKFSKGSGISKEDINDGGVTEAIRYGELYTRYGEVIDKIYSRTNILPDKLVISKVNDVIIPASGETHIDIATASCVLHNGIALGGDINIIRSDVIVGTFLAYYLNSVKRNDIARLAQGVSVVHLYSSNLKELKLDLPSMEEQRKIADFLVAIDEKIKLEESKFESAEAFKKVLLQRMFV